MPPSFMNKLFCCLAALLWPALSFYAQNKTPAYPASIILPPALILVFLGTFGLREILGAGGLCLVQDPASARYGGMPASAIAAGHVDHVLPVEQMPTAARHRPRR